MSIVKKILPFILCAALLTSTGCTLAPNASADSQSGISVSTESGADSGGESDVSESGNESGSAGELPDTPIEPVEPVEYGQELKEEAERVVLTVAEKGLSSEGVSLTAAQKEKLLAYVREYVIPVFEREGVTELKFYSVIKTIETRGAGIAAAAFSLYAKHTLTGGQYREMLALYADFAEYLGRAETAGLAYELFKERYDYQIAEYRSKYERTGYEFYLDYIAEEEENKRILTAEIGRDNFTALVSVVAELANDFGGVFSGKEDVTEEEYTDMEILTLLSLSGYRLRDLSISEKGWGACLRFAGNLLSKTADEEAGMGMSVLRLLLTEDYAALGQVAGRAAAIFSSAATALEEKDIALLRQKDFTGFASAICSRFSATEWDGLEEVFSAALRSEKYVDLLKEKGYEEAYRSYCALMQTATAEELRAAAGSAAFGARLEEYIFGKFPYFAFMLFSAARTE